MTGCDYVTAFDEFLRCMKRNVSTTVLTVLLIVCCILFFCYILYYYNVDDGSVVIKENEMYLDHTIFRFGKADYSLFEIESGGRTQGYDPFITNKTDDELYEYGLKLEQMVEEIRENGYLDYCFTNTSEKIPFSDVNNEPYVLRGYAEQGERALEMWSPFYKDAGYIIVEAAEVDINFIKNSNLVLSSGRLLTEEDYINYKHGEPVPVLLGHKYADYYNVGDLIYPYSYANNEISTGRGASCPLKVIGILEKDTIVFNAFVSSGTNMLENLDYTIVKPLLTRTIAEVPKDNTAAVAAATVMQHTRFFSTTAFYFERSMLEYGEKKLTEILDKYGYTGYYTVQNSDYNVELSESIMRERLTGLSVMTILVGFFTLFAVFVTQLHKYNRNLKTYAIYFLTGKTVKDIVSMAAIDMALLFLISFCISHIPLLILFFPDQYGGTRIYGIIKSVFSPQLYIYILILGMVFVLLSSLICFFTVRKADFPTIIKGGE